ncbi:MAG: hypothetical protein RLZZ387_4117 [Chloroflexota bacterium]
MTIIIADNEDWQATSGRHFTASIAAVRTALQRCAARLSRTTDAGDTEPGSTPADDLETLARSLPRPPVLERICCQFSLTDFERHVLVLCAGMETEADFPQLCALINGGQDHSWPTFSLAFAAFPDVAYWSAATNEAPLRRWRLIQVDNTLPTRGQLRVAERVLHELQGCSLLDAQLARLVSAVPGPPVLPESHAELAGQIAAVWGDQAGSPLQLLQLCGDDPTAVRAVAAAAAARRHLRLHALSTSALPTDPEALEHVIRLWEREAMLAPVTLLLEWEEKADAAHVAAATRFVEELGVPLLIAARERLRAIHKQHLTFDVRRPAPREQFAIWREALGSSYELLEPHVDRVVAQFDLSAQAIAASAAVVATRSPDATPAELARALWDACRSQARPQLSGLARPIDAMAGWEDLVLPEAQQEVLRDITAHVHQRAKVYWSWGLGSKSNRGLGVTALFAGPSGTGKTMAAEVLARELRVDLYRVDISQVASKYIGETEKNLNQIFTAAEAGGAILLFDEADALFAKRGEVKDSNDRYANMEVSYLLQRMEAYPGLAILTTNLKHTVDHAFLRRIRFVVQFPFPDTAQREQIWRRSFPQGTPTEPLRYERLGRLNVAGGNIRNIALNAAFIAAEEGAPVAMRHILRAAQSEYSKLEKTLTDAEVAGWIDGSTEHTRDVRE